LANPGKSLGLFSLFLKIFFMPIKPILRPVTIPERYILQWQEDGYLRNIGIKPYFQME
jgi:hypothetical protein